MTVEIGRVLGLAGRGGLASPLLKPALLRPLQLELKHGVIRPWTLPRRRNKGGRVADRCFPIRLSSVACPLVGV